MQRLARILASRCPSSFKPAAGAANRASLSANIAMLKAG
jgi:hypothetical protein